MPGHSYYDDPLVPLKPKSRRDWSLPHTTEVFLWMFLTLALGVVAYFAYQVYDPAQLLTFAPFLVSLIFAGICLVRSIYLVFFWQEPEDLTPPPPPPQPPPHSTTWF